MPPKIEMYSQETCPWCHRAKSLLEMKGVAVEEILIAGDTPEWDAMIERTGGRTTPQILIDGVNNIMRKKANMVLGDYGVISPDYSDIKIPSNAMLNVMAPKIIYTYNRKHFIIRGGAIKTHERGFKQYNDFAEIIVLKPFYRGPGYSYGDNFIEQKSRSIGKKVMPGTIIKPTVNAHITYMMKDYV